MRISTQNNEEPKSFFIDGNVVELRKYINRENINARQISI